MRGFATGVHQVRPHRGQGIVANRFRSLLPSSVHPSEISGMATALTVSLMVVVGLDIIWAVPPATVPPPLSQLRGFHLHFSGLARIPAHSFVALSMPVSGGCIVCVCRNCAVSRVVSPALPHFAACGADVLCNWFVNAFIIYRNDYQIRRGFDLNSTKKKSFSVFTIVVVIKFCRLLSTACSTIRHHFNLFIVILLAYKRLRFSIL